MYTPTPICAIYKYRIAREYNIRIHLPSQIVHPHLASPPVFFDINKTKTHIHNRTESYQENWIDVNLEDQINQFHFFILFPVSNRLRFCFVCSCATYHMYNMMEHGYYKEYVVVDGSRYFLLLLRQCVMFSQFIFSLPPF